MSPHGKSLIAACTVALFAAFVACATSDGAATGDVDAGQADPDTGASPPQDAGTQPSHGDAGPPVSPDAGTVPAPDASTCAKAPPSNVCGVSPQCGCGPSQTCDVTDNTGAVACIAAGLAGAGKACTTTAGCALGLTCFSGVCRPYCPAGAVDGDGGVCSAPATTTCRWAQTAMAAIPNLHVCRIACDLTNPSSCDVPGAPAGLVACDFDSTDQLDCLGFPPNTVDGGASCGGAVQCGPALVCVITGDAGNGNCRPWCRVGAFPDAGTAACSAGKTCSGFSTKVTVNGSEYGFCN